MVTVVQLAFVGLKRFPAVRVCISFYGKLLTRGSEECFVCSFGCLPSMSETCGAIFYPLPLPLQHTPPTSRGARTKRLLWQADEELRDILGSLLEKSPEQRLTVTEARAHSWIRSRHNCEQGGFDGYISVADSEDVVRGAADTHENGPGDS